MCLDGGIDKHKRFGPVGRDFPRQREGEFTETQEEKQLFSKSERLPGRPGHLRVPWRFVLVLFHSPCEGCEP